MKIAIIAVVVIVGIARRAGRTHRTAPRIHHRRNCCTERPTQWPDTSATHEIKLKVPGTLPRVVIIWVVEQAGDLYVVGANDSVWVDMIGQSSPVEMRLGDNTYALTATLVASGWEPILTAYVDKYRPDYPDIVAGFPSPEEAQGTVAVFRLD